MSESMLEAHMHFLRRALIAGAVAAALAMTAAPLPPSQARAAETVRMVPPGNRSASQPPVSHWAVQRTQQTRGTFEGKYRKIYVALQRNKRLLKKIRKVAAHYGIDPVHMIGAIIGEHTYNVDSVDYIQSYYIKAAEYAGLRIEFAYEGESVSEFVERPQFARCRQYSDSYRLWSCRQQVWTTVFRGRMVDGRAFPNARLDQVFFQPLYAGQTFGLGQLSPLTALKMTDLVSRHSGLRKLSADDAPRLYEDIIDPDSTLHYMAAIIWRDIQTYKEVAGFDISRNPGLTATLYNLGDAPVRAAALRKANRKRQAAGEPPLYPRENYYGWLVNHKIDELRALL